MIVFAAHVPHSPLLLKTVGKTKRKPFKATIEALQRVAESLSRARPDTIVVISSHATIHPNAFSINLHDEYYVDLTEFGDLATDREFAANPSLVDTIQRALRRDQVQITLDSDAKLDYGTSVPLLLLTENVPDIRIVPISDSGLPAKDHFLFGRALKEVLATRPERIAVISSGDLSHSLTSTSPAGFQKEGEKFDQAVRLAIEHNAASQLLSFEPEFVFAAADCAYRQLLVLFGVLEQTNVRTEVLSYEAPLGVGMLVAQFHLL